MKNFKNVFLLSSFAFFLMAAIACKHSHDHSDHSDSTEETQVDKTTREYTSTYVCPMHCEGSGSEEAGTCPVCGMDYVLNEDHKTDGHQHDEAGHEGHNH